MKKYGKMRKVIKNQTKPNQIEPVKAMETLERFHISPSRFDSILQEYYSRSTDVVKNYK